MEYTKGEIILIYFCNFIAEKTTFMKTKTKKVYSHSQFDELKTFSKAQYPTFMEIYLVEISINFPLCSIECKWRKNIISFSLYMYISLYTIFYLVSISVTKSIWNMWMVNFQFQIQSSENTYLIHSFIRSKLAMLFINVSSIIIIITIFFFNAYFLFSQSVYLTKNRNTVIKKSNVLLHIHFIWIYISDWKPYLIYVTSVLIYFWWLFQNKCLLCLYIMRMKMLWTYKTNFT